MKNKWFAILFSVIFLLMMIGAPTTLLLTKAGILPKENVGNAITPDKTYPEGSFLYGPLTAIERAKVAIKDTYINYLPGFLNITNTAKPLKSKIDRPVIDWLAERGRGMLTEVCHHVFSETVVSPTCEEGGYTLKVCRLCEASEQVAPTPALGHTFDAVGATVPIGCDTYGYTPKSCVTCHTVILTDKQDPTGHTFRLVTERPADCDSEGNLHYLCEGCGEQYVLSTPVTHTYTATLHQAAGGAEAYVTHDCTGCDKQFRTGADEAAGHIHKDTVRTVAPTCGEAGYTERTCTVCGDVRRDTPTLPSGHRYLSEIVAATCRTGGYTRHVCDSCHGEETVDAVAPLGHSYAVTTVAPTVYEEGYDLHSCVRCTHTMKMNFTPKLILGLPTPETVRDPAGTRYSATLLSRPSGDGFRIYAMNATYPDGTKDMSIVRIIAMDRERLFNRMLDTTDLIDAMVSKNREVNWYFAFTGNMETTALAKEFFPEEDASYIYEDFLSRLPASVKTADIEINSFTDYANKYYITDHHWNHTGVMEAYYRIMAMLRENYADAAPMPLDGLYYYPDVPFYGSLSRKEATYAAVDPFGVYMFDLPAHRLEIDTAITYGATVPQADRLAIYEAGRYETKKGYNHYTEFFRVPKKIVYPGNNTGRNLLLIGDSYSLPLIELVAASFDTTYVRYEDRSFNADPDDLYYDEFIRENDITDVIVLEEFVKVIQGYGTAWPSGFIDIYPDRAWRAREED
ncbi:MAG: hypothetical protein J6T24_09445 [Clostridia bacterium]|nr:hypothetical protein [Clostridia bacterium]